MNTELKLITLHLLLNSSRLFSKYNLIIFEHFRNYFIVLCMYAAHIKLHTLILVVLLLSMFKTVVLYPCFRL